MIHTEAWYKQAFESLELLWREYLRDVQDTPYNLDWWRRLTQLADRQGRVLDLAKWIEGLGLPIDYVEFLEDWGPNKSDSMLEAIGYLSVIISPAFDNGTGVYRRWPKVSAKELLRIPERYYPIVRVVLRAVGWEGPGEPDYNTILGGGGEKVPKLLQSKHYPPEGWDPLGNMIEWEWNDYETSNNIYMHRSVYLGLESPYTDEGQDRWQSEEYRDVVRQIRESDTSDILDDEAWMDLDFHNSEMLVLDVIPHPANRPLLKKWLKEMDI